MDAAQLVATLAPSATIRELSTSGNKIFRILEESGRSSILKVFATPARERRERHALEALADVPGVPDIIERGLTEGLTWIRMPDGGGWNLASLPKNPATIAKAGALLRAIHDSGASITNLESGIDGDYISAHFRSVLQRLERYRRRLGIPADILKAAQETTNIPVGSAPRPAHTQPSPRNFLVTESGEVTLVDWEWATLAPPEWDVSLASWTFDREIGEGSAKALWEGYGESFPQIRLKAWTAYHAAAKMLDAAEKRDGRLGDLAYLVDDLASCIQD